MKALKSSLAKAVLADPKGKAELRRFLDTKRDAATGRFVIELEIQKKKRRLVPSVVAKAS
jgi:hypothetical protein